jgi:hypothetical protein
MIQDLNPLLQKALAGFVPEFGSEEDLRIVNDIGKVYEKLKTVNIKNFREAERKKDYKALTSKMKEVQMLEESLYRRINKRNLDF